MILTNKWVSVAGQDQLPELRGLGAYYLWLPAFWHCLDNDEADLELEEAILKDEDLRDGVCGSLTLSSAKLPHSSVGGTAVLDGESTVVGGI